MAVFLMSSEKIALFESLASAAPPRSMVPYRPLATSVHRVCAMISAGLLLTFPGGFGIVSLAIGVWKNDTNLVVSGAGLLVMWLVVTLLLWLVLWTEQLRLERVLRHGSPCSATLFFSGASYLVSFRDSRGQERVGVLGMGEKAPEYWGAGAVTILHSTEHPDELALVARKKHQLVSVKIRPPRP